VHIVIIQTKILKNLTIFKHLSILLGQTIFKQDYFKWLVA